MLDGKENTHGITTSEKKTYTVDEIAALLNISMKSAYALVKSGQFHYIRAGRMIRGKRTIASTCSYASFSAIIVSHDTESKKLST